MKKISSLLVMALLLTGCGAVPVFSRQTLDSQEEGIELLDPVSLYYKWEKAARRNLYDVECFEGEVALYTEEYGFDIDASIGEFLVFPGDSVSKGELLFAADQESLEDSIKLLEEQIRDLDESFQEYQESVEESLVEPEKEEDYLRWVVTSYEEAEWPEQYIYVVSGGDAQGSGAGASDAGTSGNVEQSDTDISGGNAGGTVSGGDSQPMQRVLNPDYQVWERYYNNFNGQYRILAHSNDTLRQQLSQRKALYELERSYLESSLQRLLGKKTQYEVRSSMAGEIVALRQRSLEYESHFRNDYPVYPMGTLRKGTAVARQETLVSIGNPNHKLIRSEFISSSLIHRAKDVYALVNNDRYEVAYQPITEEEVKIRSAGGTVYTTFEIMDGAGELSAGDYVQIVVVLDEREDVLTVPSESVHKDRSLYQESGTFVYRRQGEGYESVAVTTGMSDDVYTEIVSGLSDGDEVQVSSNWTTGRRRATLEKRHDVYSTDTIATLFFPVTWQVKNPVEHGTTLFVQFEKNMYDYVQEGEVLATVRVTSEDASLERLQVQAQRMKERLDDLIKEDQEREEKQNEKEIENQREAIAELEEEIGEIRGDYETTQIVAPHSGLLIYKDMDVCYAEGVVPTDHVIAEIANVEDCYVLIDVDVPYGKELNLTYQWSSGDKAGEEPLQFTGKCVYASNRMLSEDLQSSFRLVHISNEAAEAIREDHVTALRDALREYSQELSEMGYVYRDIERYQMSFELGVDYELMNEDVLVVPKSAVKLRGGQNYVLVVEDDEIIARSFVGLAVMGNGDYYVLDGLTEGMEVCTD